MLYLAIPAMNEAAFLPQTLQCLQNQTGLDPQLEIQVWVCINQPEAYRDDPVKHDIFLNNQKTLAFLHQSDLNNLRIIDHSSRGKGWSGKGHGVGMARKVLMDAINREALPGDIIVSMDADTSFGPGYLASIAGLFQQYPNAVALSNPYYHRLSGNETLDRAMLRYEIYMRHYAINLWRIGSPYSFTALGSAIALPVHAYRKIGGMTAKKSGEDFYLLQKLRKAGWIINYNTEKVYPGTRYSDRVFFGTGPALIKGSQGLWESYPIYGHELFDKVQQTYELFPVLFYEQAKTPMDDFFRSQFPGGDIFQPLRQNTSTPGQFVKACHHKIDGLRILQFLKSSQAKTRWSDEEHLKRFLSFAYPGSDNTFSSWDKDAWDKLDFAKTPVDILNKIRNFLMEKETAYQYQNLSLEK